MSEFTRLLAIGLLNYADDEGYFYAAHQAIRGAVFPFMDDSMKIHGALMELAGVGYVALGKSKDGRSVGKIVNFEKHQVISRPKPSVIGPFEPEKRNSLNNHGVVMDSSVRDHGAISAGMEGKGKEKEVEQGCGDLECKCHEDDMTPDWALEFPVEELPDPEETDPVKLRLFALFNRRKTRLMTGKEEKAFRKAAIKIQDLESVEEFYADPHPEWEGKDFRRRDLETLLNNWSSEVDKAENWDAYGRVQPKQKQVFSKLI